MNKINILLKNISFNFLAQFWFLLLSFFTTPFIVNTLGNDAFGVYSIIGVVMGYFSFLDLGLGNAIIKYLAEYYGKKDYKKMSQIIGTSLFSYCIIGFFGAFLLSLTTSFIVSSLLHIPTPLINIAKTSLYISALGFLINMPLAIYGNIPNALARMDITNIRNIIIGTINTLGIVYLLHRGFGLVEIVILNIALSIVGIIVYIIASKKLLPQVSFKISFDKEMFSLLLKFGIFKFVNQISGQIIFHLDKLLIGLFLPIAYVSYYTIPLTLSQKAMSLIFNVAGAFFPTASELSAREDKGPFRQLYSRAIKLSSIIIIPIFIMLFIYAKDILFFWIKGDYYLKSATTLKLLSLAYLIQSFTTIPSLAAESMGKPKVTAGWALFTGVLNLVFCLFLIPIFKINGAAISIFLSSLIACPLSIYFINKKVLSFSNRELFSQTVAKALLASLIALPIFFIFKIFFLKSLYLLLGCIFLGEVSYLLICLFIGAIDKEDIRIFTQFIRRKND